MPSSEIHTQWLILLYLPQKANQAMRKKSLLPLELFPQTGRKRTSKATETTEGAAHWSSGAN